MSHKGMSKQAPSDTAKFTTSVPSAQIPATERPTASARTPPLVPMAEHQGAVVPAQPQASDEQHMSIGVQEERSAFTVDQTAAATDQADGQEISVRKPVVPSSEAASTTGTAHSGIVDEHAEEGETAIELLESSLSTDQESFNEESSTSKQASTPTSSPPGHGSSLGQKTSTALYDIHRENESRTMEYTTGAACGTSLLLNDIIEKLSDKTAENRITRRKLLLEAVDNAVQDFAAEFPDRLTTHNDSDEDRQNVSMAKRSAETLRTILERELPSAVVASDTKLMNIVKGVEQVRDHMEAFFVTSTDHHADSSSMVSTPTKQHEDTDKPARKRKAAEAIMTDFVSSLIVDDDASACPQKQRTVDDGSSGLPKKRQRKLAGGKSWSPAEDLQIIRMKRDPKTWNDKGDSTTVTGQRTKVFNTWCESIGLPHERSWDAIEQHLNKLTNKDRVTTAQLEKQLGLEADGEITKAHIDINSTTMATTSKSPIAYDSAADATTADQKDTVMPAATLSTEADTEAVKKTEVEIEADKV